MRRKAIFILLNGLLRRGVHLICIQWHVLMDIFNVSKWTTTTKYFQKSLLSTKEGRKHKHLLMISFLGQVYFQSVISILTVPHRPQNCFKQYLLLPEKFCPKLQIVQAEVTVIPSFCTAGPVPVFLSCHVTCPAGYTIQGNLPSMPERNLVCQLDETWSESIPTCRGRFLILYWERLLQETSWLCTRIFVFFSDEFTWNLKHCKWTLLTRLTYCC